MSNPQTPTTDRSDCHNAPVTIGGDDSEGTHYYVCSKCNNACDLTVTPSPSNGLLKLRKELDKLDVTPTTADWIRKVIIECCGEYVLERHQSLLPELEAHMKQVVVEARIDELKQLKKRSTQHAAYKIDQYGSELDTTDIRLAVPNRKIEDMRDE